LAVDKEINCNKEDPFIEYLQKNCKEVFYSKKCIQNPAFSKKLKLFDKAYDIFRNI